MTVYDCINIVMGSLTVAQTEGKTTTIKSNKHLALLLHNCLSSVMSAIFASMHLCINSSTSCRVFLPATLAPLLAPSLLAHPQTCLPLEVRKDSLADRCGLGQFQNKESNQRDPRRMQTENPCVHSITLFAPNHKVRHRAQFVPKTASEVPY